MLKQRKIFTYYQGQRFEIVEDLPEIGYYIYVYNPNNNCISDHLQDTLLTAKKFAFEKYGIPVDAWKTTDS